MTQDVEKSGDMPATNPTDEIEITPEMIEAGEAAIWCEMTGTDPHPFFSAEVLARRVFEEMLRVSKETHSFEPNGGRGL